MNFDRIFPKTGFEPEGSLNTNIWGTASWNTDRNTISMTSLLAIIYQQISGWLYLVKKNVIPKIYQSF